MVKFSLYYISFLLFGSIAANAQVLLVKLNPQDCNKCQIIIESLFDESVNRIPTYIIFPEAYKDSKERLEELLDLKSNQDKIKYSNSLYSQIGGYSMTSIHYIDSEGKSIFNKSLTDFSRNDVAVWNEYYENDYLFGKDMLVPTRNKIFPDGNSWTKHDIFLSKYTIKGGEYSSVYTFDNTAISDIKSKIKVNLPGYWDLTDYTFDSLPEFRALLKPSSTIYQSIDTSTIFHSLSIPTVFWIEDEEERKRFNDSLKLRNIRILAKYKNEILEDAFLAGYEDGDNHIIGGVFYPVNDSMVLYLYSAGLIPFDTNEKRKFIGLFKLKNNEIVLEKHLDNDIPYIYKEKQLGYTFLSLAYVAYPYFITLYSNELLNLETGDNYALDYPFPLDFERITDNFVENKFSEEIKTEEPFENLRLSFNKEESLIDIFVLKDGNLYLLKVSGETHKVISYVNLSKHGIGVREDANGFAQFVYSKKMLYIEDKSNKIRGYPIGIFDYIASE